MGKIRLILHGKRKERRKINGITPRHKFPKHLKGGVCLATHRGV
jgi:hypothetical protein